MQRMVAEFVRRNIACIHDVERTHRERHEIGRQWPGRFEQPPRHAVVCRLLPGRRVSDDLVVRWRSYGDVERGLESWLIKRRKGAACVGVFKLGEGIRIAMVHDLVKARK